MPIILSLFLSLYSPSRLKILSRAQQSASHIELVQSLPKKFLHSRSLYLENAALNFHTRELMSGWSVRFVHCFPLQHLRTDACLLATGTTVHVVKVGSTNSSLTYTPNSLKANVGDMVQFQFSLANHTVTQSTFDQPCQPIALNTNQTGMFSGFMPVKATDTMAPVYTIQVTSTTPMWLYCSQGKHCQAGMVMVINEK